MKKTTTPEISILFNIFISLSCSTLLTRRKCYQDTILIVTDKLFTCWYCVKNSWRYTHVRHVYLRALASGGRSGGCLRRQRLLMNWWLINGSPDRRSRPHRLVPATINLYCANISHGVRVAILKGHKQDNYQGRRARSTTENVWNERGRFDRGRAYLKHTKFHHPNCVLFSWYYETHCNSLYNGFLYNNGIMI
jgi:hypothetical protein